MTLYESFCGAVQFLILSASLIVLLLQYVDDEHETLAKLLGSRNANPSSTDQNNDGSSGSMENSSEQHDRDGATCDSLPYPALPEEALQGHFQMCGISIKDRFQSLEDLNSPQTQEWLQQQKVCTEKYLSSTGPVKEILEKKLAASCRFDEFDTPFQLGNRYFFYKRLHESDDQLSLFCTYDLRTEAVLVFNPNVLDVEYDENTMGSTYSYTSTDIEYDSSIAVFAVWLSQDGHQLAFGYARSFDSPAMTIGVKNVRVGEVYLDDTIRHCSVRHTSLCWMRSAFGFFYTIYEALTVVPAEGADSGISPLQKYTSKVLFHRIGSTQNDDIVVFETITDSAAISLNVQVTHDGHYLLLDIFKSRHHVSANSLYRTCISENCSQSSEGNKLYYFDLSKFDGQSVDTMGPCIKLIDTFSYRFEYITNIEEYFWFRTNYQAGNFRVVRISLIEDIHLRVEPERMAHTLLHSWKSCLDWIPERLDGDYLESGRVAAQTVLVLKYLRNSSHEVLLYDLTQTLLQQSQIPVADLPHPSFGTICDPNCGYFSDEIFYKFSSLSDPGSIYRAIITREAHSGSIEFSFDQVNTADIPGIDKFAFETVEEYCKSSSNQQIPMLIFGEVDSFEEPKRPLPCILIPSCSFGAPLTPRFNLPLMILVRYFGALVVLANLQGSGIYGMSYAQGGSKNKSSGAADDLMSVIKHLVNRGYTTQSQLGVYGGAAASVAIGACIAQKPSAFATAVISDGLFDLIKYHRFNQPLIESNVRLLQPSHCSSEQAPDEDRENRPWQNTLWYSEFGCAEESADECRRLLELSPLHLLGARSSPTFSYPALMLSIGDMTRSNCVSCKHSLKFVAELQRTFGSQTESQFKALLLHMTADSIQNSSIGSDCSGSDEAAESAFVGASDSGSKEVYSANDCPAVIAQLAFLLHNLIIEGQS